MRRRTVYRVSVVLSVLGLGVMYGVDGFIGAEEVGIAEIDESWTGEHVRITGEVERFTPAHGHLFLDLQEEGHEISVVEFDSDTWIETGEPVTVTGYVDIYEGDLQVVAEEIR